MSRNQRILMSALLFAVLWVFAVVSLLALSFIIAASPNPTSVQTADDPIAYEIGRNLGRTLAGPAGIALLAILAMITWQKAPSRQTRFGREALYIGSVLLWWMASALLFGLIRSFLT